MRKSKFTFWNTFFVIKDFVCDRSSDVYVIPTELVFCTTIVKDYHNAQAYNLDNQYNMKKT